MNTFEHSIKLIHCCRREKITKSTKLLFSCSIMSDSLWPHGLQHARHPCPSPSLSLLKLMFIEFVMASSHLILCRPFLLLSSIFPSIRVFLMSQLFTSGDQSFGASASVLPMIIQGWFPLGLIGLISLLFNKTLKMAIVHHSSIFQKESLEWIYQNPVCFWTPTLVPHSSF